MANPAEQITDLNSLSDQQLLELAPQILSPEELAQLSVESVTLPVNSLSQTNIAPRLDPERVQAPEELPPPEREVVDNEGLIKGLRFVGRAAAGAAPALATAASIGTGGAAAPFAIPLAGIAGALGSQAFDVSTGEKPSLTTFGAEAALNTLFPYLFKGVGGLKNWVWPNRAKVLGEAMQEGRAPIRTGVLLGDNKSMGQNAAIGAVSDTRLPTKLPGDLQAAVPDRTAMADVDYLLSQKLAHSPEGKPPLDIFQAASNLEKNIEIANQAADDIVGKYTDKVLADPEAIVNRMKASLTRYMQGTGAKDATQALDKLGDLTNGIIEVPQAGAKLYGANKELLDTTAILPDVLRAPKEALNVGTARERMRAIDNMLRGLDAYDVRPDIQAQFRPESVPFVRPLLMEMRTALRDSIARALPDGATKGAFLKANEQISRGLNVSALMSQKADMIAGSAGIQTGNSLNANVKGWPAQAIGGALDPQRVRPAARAMTDADAWAQNYNYMADAIQNGLLPRTPPQVIGAPTSTQLASGPITSNLLMGAFGPSPAQSQMVQLPQTARAVRDNVATILMQMQDKSMQEQFTNKLNGTDAELRKFMAEAASFDPNLKQLFEPSQSKYPNVLFDVVIDPQTRFQMYQETARKAHQGDIQSTTWYRNSKKLERGLAVE